MRTTESRTMEPATDMDGRGLVVSCGGCGQRNRIPYDRLGETFRCGKCQAALALPTEPIDVPSEDAFISAVARSTRPVLVDFWAAWCGPCKMVAPEVAKVAAELSGQLLVLKVNTEMLQGVAQQFGISGIPTFILFQQGNEVARQAGAMSSAQIKRFVEGAAR